MPKSRNRKNHKKKVQARNMRLKGEQKKMMEQMEVLKDQYLKEINKKSEETSKDDSGDVPFTLGPESIQPTKM
tara:strand:- start:85 stop:303 length:219 start_codon:yes stop_codon:yes gene_type:complete